MSRLRFIPLLLVAPLACSDTPGPTEPPAIVADEDVFQVVEGTVLSSSMLLGNDGHRYPLIGPQSIWLENLIGAEIRLRGDPDERDSRVMWIVEFRVLTVDGLPALDGTLHQHPAGGFAVRTPDGGINYLREIPSGLLGYVGKRVWLAMRDGDCVRYGALEE